jgi:Reverse transcriptase (RNA-dependent DNA polymerase)
VTTLPDPLSHRNPLPIDRIHELDIKNKKKLRCFIRRRPKVAFAESAEPSIIDAAIETPPLASLDALPDNGPNPPFVSPVLVQPTLSGAVGGGIVEDPSLLLGGIGKQPTAQDIPVKKPAYALRPRRSLNAKLATGFLALGSVTFFHSHQAHAVEFEGLNIHDLPSIEPVTPDFMGLHASQRAQLRYVQACDSAMEDLADSDDAQWKVVRVLEHKITKDTRVNQQKEQVGVRHLRLRVQWLNGTDSWVQEAGVRTDDPFSVIQYAVAKGLLKHPDFKWIKEYAEDAERLTEMKHAFAAKQHGPKFKFGVQVPVSPKHALALDIANGNTLWQDAIEKELKQINEYETFRQLLKGETLASDYQRIPYHFVFDVKFDLRRKARLVAGGNWTDTPKEDIYSGVVGMDTIRLGFTVAAMNDLDVCATDIGNAFLYGKTRERVYVIAGPEFGELEGQRLIIDKGLYGLKTSAARFHEHLAKKLRTLGFKPTLADTDFWMRKCGGHYEYIATYVDDLLVYSKDCKTIIDEIEKDYILKGTGKPEYYLGGDVDHLDDQWERQGIKTALSAKTYIENVTEKLETMMGGKPFAKFSTPMCDIYHPEMDSTPFLNQVGVSKFRAFIGSANWIITLGRFDIAYATNALSRFSMQPREGHMKAVQRMFGYLKKFAKGGIVIDPNYRDNSKYRAKIAYFDNWKEFYSEAKEELPYNLVEPLGLPARITIYKDADHAHDLLTRRSVTGILLMVNNTPVKWISKRQKTVETSTYGSEMVAGRIATELAIEYRNTLRLLGVPIDGPALMLGDNQSVVLSTSVPSSILKKKHNAIAYHRIREAIAAGIIDFVHIDTTENYADILTKPLAGPAFHRLVKPLLFRNALDWMNN